MSYVRKDYPSKKALKDAVASLAVADPKGPVGQSLRRDLAIIPTAVTGRDPHDGEAFLEGPHYPKPHKWYAKVRVDDGIVTKVLS